LTRGRETQIGREEEAAVTSEAEEKNEALVRKFFEEVRSKGNVAAVDEFAAPDFMDHDSLPGQESSREE
jgi:hypothetical protein